jgi:hypothetical protein
LQNEEAETVKAFLERWLKPTSDAPSQMDEIQEVDAADSLSTDVSVADYSEEIQLPEMTDDETAWRVEVFLTQIPDTRPVPFLVAGEAINPGPGACHSCGELLMTERGYRCGPCSRAVNLALESALARKPEPGEGESIE